MKRSWKLAAVVPAVLAGLGLLILPGALKLRGFRPPSLDGVHTVDDAIAAGRRSGLKGWDLVTWAQCLVHRKFAFYSARNLWDTPARAFEHGMGYCTQYNLALQQILAGLGIDARAVFSLRVDVLDDPGWAMGHTWLRATVAGDTRDVCAGSAQNRPGQVRFRPLLPVWPGSDLFFLLSHAGVILVAGAAEWLALIGGRGDPGWTFRAQTATADPARSPEVVGVMDCGRLQE